MGCHRAVTPSAGSWAGNGRQVQRGRGGRLMRRLGQAALDPQASEGVAPLAQSCDDRDRGALSLMLVVLFVALVALAGIVVDGGAKLDASEQAYALAQEAARAGATTVDASSAYGTGSFVVDPQQALAAARGYLTAAGQGNYQVRAVGQRRIWVSVTITEPTTFLSLIGISSFTCTGTATASLVAGVTGGT
jgi:Flp pilus assembly protein TadG